MDHTEPTIKRPRVSFMPHHHDGPPELWCGNFKYQYDRRAALYHVHVLMDWLYRTQASENTPSTAFSGDE